MPNPRRRPGAFQIPEDVKARAPTRAPTMAPVSVELTGHEHADLLGALLLAVDAAKAAHDNAKQARLQDLLTRLAVQFAATVSK